MELRTEVKIEGIPLTWETNLSDDELLLLYNLLQEDDEFMQFLEDRSMFSMFSKTIEFMDGAVLFSSIMDIGFGVYRNAVDWARWLEQQELQEEKEDETTVAVQLFETEDEFLANSARQNIQKGSFHEGACDLMRRIALREQHVNIERELQRRDLWYIEYDLALSFSQFPETNYGLKYLQVHAATIYEFIRFCEWFHMHNVPSQDEVPKGLLRSPIPQNMLPQFLSAFECAKQRFPSDGRLHKDFALFFERCGAFTTALEVCHEGLKKGLEDGTKKGFSGRIKRLERKKDKWNGEPHQAY